MRAFKFYNLTKIPPVIFHLIRRCSYQHMGFVLLETAPDPDVMGEHRHAEVFWGPFNCFESWRQRLLLYIHQIAAKANHHKTSAESKMPHQYIELLQPLNIANFSAKPNIVFWFQSPRWSQCSTPVIAWTDAGCRLAALGMFK